jgi:hypothetical protein
VGGTPGALAGTWVDAVNDEGYAITATELTYYIYGGFSSGTINYKGTIVNSPDFNQEQGIVIIQYTEAPAKTEYTPAGTVGAYYAIAWRGLTADTVELSNAYKTGGLTETASLDAAREEFTPAKGYFDYYGSYSKP